MSDRRGGTITLEDLTNNAELQALSADDMRRLGRLLAGRNFRYAQDDDGQPFGRVLYDYLDWLDEHNGDRWPVIRRGERAEIPWVVRLSIYRRDQFMCQSERGKHFTEEPELDHCVPWSAGGPDDSDNLRALCHNHNQYRSNYIDFAHEHIHRPTTWWCVGCWAVTDSDEDGPTYPRRRDVWKDGTWLDRVPFVDTTRPMQQVYCAWCEHYSMSEHYFVGLRGVQLAAMCLPPAVRSIQ